MFTKKSDEIIGKTIAVFTFFAILIAVPYLWHIDKNQTTENSIVDAITCIESKYCMSPKSLSPSVDRYAGEYKSELIGQEHQTTLGNADFYRITLPDQTYFLRVDARKNLVIQYFKVGGSVSEQELIKRYDIY